METYRRYSAPAVPASRILFFDHGKNGKNGNFLQVADVLKGVTPLALLFPTASDLQFPSAAERCFVRLPPFGQWVYDESPWSTNPKAPASVYAPSKLRR